MTIQFFIMTISPYRFDKFTFFTLVISLFYSLFQKAFFIVVFALWIWQFSDKITFFRSFYFFQSDSFTLFHVSIPHFRSNNSNFCQELIFSVQNLIFYLFFFFLTFAQFSNQQFQFFVTRIQLFLFTNSTFSYRKVLS